MGRWTKLLAAAVVALALIAWLAFELDAPAAEAQGSHNLDVLAVGDPNGVTLRFRYPDFSSSDILSVCPGCPTTSANVLGHYRWKAGMGAWSAQQDILPQAGPPHRAINGAYTLRIDGLPIDTLPKDTEYTFEVWFSVRQGNARVTIYKGSDTATARAQTATIRSVPQLSVRPSSGYGTWQAGWSDPSACSSGCDFYELAFRSIYDADEPSNWQVYRFSLDIPRPKRKTFDTRVRVVGRTFPDRVVVEVSYWKGKTVVARSRTTGTPSALPDLKLMASGPDIQSRGDALRQVGLSWKIHQSDKYRIRYTEGDPEDPDVAWSQWEEALTVQLENQPRVRLEDPLTLPREDTEYTIEVQSWVRFSGTDIEPEGVLARGRTRVHTWANYAPTFDNLPDTRYIQPDADTNPTFHTILATDRNHDKLTFSKEGTWDGHFNLTEQGIVLYTRRDENLKLGDRYELAVRVTEVGRGGLSSRAVLRVVVGSPPAPVQDTGPIPHAIWCDVVDGEGVCLTAGGGKFQPPYARTAVQITNGAFHHCALDAEGRARCWGDDTYGQVSGLPKQHVYTRLGNGWTFSCGLTESGDIYCWGYNGAGQTNAPAPGTGPWVWLSVGNDFACALDANGRAVCWGNRNFGQLEVPPGLRFGHLAAGGYHVCAITTAGETVCWGAKARAFRSIGAVDAPSTAQFINLSALRYQTCGRTVAGEIICWGAGRFSEEHYPWMLHAPAPSWALIVGAPLADAGGAPAAISMELELDIYAGGLLDSGPYPGDQFQLTFIATVVDADGRPVADGTAVSWEIPTENQPELFSLGQDLATTGGRAEARYLLLGPEPFTVVASAADIDGAMAFPPPVESTAIRWAHPPGE